MLRNEKCVNHFLDSAQWPNSRIIMMPKTLHSPAQVACMIVRGGGLAPAMKGKELPCRKFATKRP